MGDAADMRTLLLRMGGVPGKATGKMYSGKAIRVTGPVREVDLGFGEPSLYVHMSTKDNYGVWCRFGKHWRERMGPLKSGRPVTVRGNCRVDDSFLPKGLDLGLRLEDTELVEPPGGAVGPSR